MKAGQINQAINAMLIEMRQNANVMDEAIVERDKKIEEQKKTIEFQVNQISELQNKLSEFEAICSPDPSIIKETNNVK